MVLRARLAVALLVTILLTSALAPAAGLRSVAAGPGAATGGGVRLLSSTDRGVTFEVSVPWEQLRIEPWTAGEKAYVRVSLPAWQVAAQAGAPALPMLAEAIGVPFGVGLEVSVEPGPAHRVALPAPALPAETLKVEWGPPGSDGIAELPEPALVVEEDPTVYDGATPFPGVLAEVTNDGAVRGQRVVGIAVYPVQYNPEGQDLTVYESLRLEVQFEGRVIAGAAAAYSSVYEGVFRQSLLNYEAARAWRSAAGDVAGVESAPWAPPDPGWRVKVREGGFYELTYAELDAAGLPVDTSLATSTFQLYNLGSESAIHVIDVDEDGVFDAEDSLLFYGQAVASKYTADNVYWLTYGQGTGLRMASRDGTPGTADTPTYYEALRHVEQNAYYVPLVPGDDDLERWFWAWVRSTVPSTPVSWTYSFSLAAPHAAPATLRLAMLGFGQNAIDPDHHVEIYLNGTDEEHLVGDVWWDGLAWVIPEMDIAPGLLQAGTNTLNVVCPNDTGVGTETDYIDWFELDFANSFLAEGDELAFTYAEAGTWKYQVEGFSLDQVAVYDVTNPAAVVRIEGGDVLGSGPYTAVFEDTVAGPTKYWALAETATRTVVGIEPDTSALLPSPGSSVDYIVIAPQAFSAQAAMLRDFRLSQGLGAVAVDVQEVYDEFGYGMVGAAAIHDFLAYAYDQWPHPAPSYVVLVGDGHYDPKNYAGYGRVSYIPPYLANADPEIGETAADNRYVTLVGEDRLPDMMLGRLAVNSGAEASAFVDKTVAYEQGPPEDWQQQVLAVADDFDGRYDFAAMSDDLLACCLPEPYQAERVYYTVTHPTVDGARAAIQDAINAGVLVVNYIGHAASTQWAGEGLFKAADVSGLTNAGKYPLVLPMACMDGYYVYPFATNACTAEVITRAQDKGAVASWSATGYGEPGGHRYLDQGFFNALFQDEVETVGAATAGGKLDLWASGGNLDQLDTYLLFGDPALRLPARIAAEFDLQLGKAVEPVGTVLPGTVLTYTLSFSNLGPHTARGVMLTDTLPLQLAAVDIVNCGPIGPDSVPDVVHAGVAQQPIPGEPYVWELGDLSPGAGDEICLRATVDPLAAAGTLSNEAEISAANPDFDPSDNFASVSNEIVLLDLVVGKTGPLEATYGDTITYTVGWGNASVAAVPRVLLTDTLPAGVSYVADDSGWTHSEAEPGVIVWSLSPDPLPVAAEGTFVLTATVGSDADGPLVNKVVIAADVADGNPVSYQDQWTTELLPPNLWVHKSVDPSGNLAPGAILTYTLTFGNGGPGMSHGVLLTDTLPSELVDIEILYESLEVVDRVPGETYAWEIADLAPGAGGEIRILARVASSAAGLSIVNAAQIAGTGVDPEPLNNEASAITEVSMWRLYLPLVLR